MVRSSVAVVALCSTGCFTIHPYETVEKIAVHSNPPGALVTMTDVTGSRAIGQAPLEAEVTVVHDRYEFNPWLSWILTAVSLAGFGVSTGFAIDPPDQRLDSGIVRDHQTVKIFAITGSVLFGLASLVAVPMTISGHFNDGEDVGLRYKNGPPAFAATLAGHTDATALPTLEEIPPAAPLALELTKKEEMVAVLGGVELGGLVGRENERPVLAVFDLDPGNTGLAEEIASQLSDYLTAKIASGGRYRIVPRSELRARLSGEKKTSYRDCFDETCQIELGKAVAAEKTLAAKLIRVGDTCALTATVFDLKSEAADAAQTVRTGCEQNGLMDAVDNVADRLSQH